MLNGAFGKPSSTSLMGEYSSLLGEAILRHRTRVAEHKARVESDLANRIKSEFISNMSHELRTPLNTVIGFSKLLTEHDRRKLPADQVVEYARLIHDAAGHLLSVINDILDISKIQSGKYTLDRREVALDEVLRAAISSLRMSSKEARLEIVQSIAPDVPPVRGDAAKLKQIFTNLISNAVKFTPAGGTVTIEARRRADDGAVVIIRDTGVGMSDEEIRLALQLFSQVDGSRIRVREGTGLGLPIAKSLIELHGGELHFRSSKDCGTEVTVILPSRHQVTVAEGRDAILGNGI